MTTTTYSVFRWLLRFMLAGGLAVLVALALAIILIAVPLTRRFLIVALADCLLGGRLESLAVDLDIQQNLRWIFTLLVVLPVGFGLARMSMARDSKSAARGLALAAGTLLILGLVVWWQTRQFNFDAKGRSVIYLSFRRDGAHKSYSPGLVQVVTFATGVPPQGNIVAFGQVSGPAYFYPPREVVLRSSNRVPQPRGPVVPVYRQPQPNHR
jgi:hypothetical protein